MKVDACITPSRWQQYAQWMGVSVLIAVLLSSQLPGVWQMVCISLLIVGQWFTLYLAKQKPQCSMLWQGDRAVWYWRLQGDKRTYRGNLLTLRSYGVLVYVVLKTGRGIRRMVIWRDQVNAEQWQYLMIHAHLTP